MAETERVGMAVDLKKVIRASIASFMGYIDAMVEDSMKTMPDKVKELAKKETVETTARGGLANALTYQIMTDEELMNFIMQLVVATLKHEGGVEMSMDKVKEMFGGDPEGYVRGKLDPENSMYF